MIVKSSKAKKKNVWQMKISEYKINKKFSAALIEINGNHGKIKCIKEDRIYFIIHGKGRFVIGNKSKNVSKNDVIFIPKNTPYNIIGKMTFLVICSPEFNAKHDVKLK